MNNDEAFIKGANAFQKGKPRLPTLDPSLHPFTNKGLDLSNPETQELFKQWYRGWDSANLKQTEEAHELWMEHLGYQDELKRGIENVEGVTFNDNGSITLSPDWLIKNSEKDINHG